MINEKYKALDIAIKTLAEKIDAPSDLLPTYITTEDGAWPHIVIDDEGQFHFIVVERGKELDHRTTKDMDQLLFWIFSGVTFSMSSAFSAKQHPPDTAFRKILFAKQE